MRYLKPALVGLVGGLLVVAAVLTVEFIHAERLAASQIADCLDVTLGGSVCSSAVQVGGVVEVLIAFALGFAAAIIWFRQRQQRHVV